MMNSDKRLMEMDHAGMSRVKTKQQHPSNLLMYNESGNIAESTSIVAPNMQSLKSNVLNFLNFD
jgi:hypothetical protein